MVKCSSGQSVQYDVWQWQQQPLKYPGTLYPGPGKCIPVKQADLGCAVGWTERINSAGITTFGVWNKTGWKASANSVDQQ